MLKQKSSPTVVMQIVIARNVAVAKTAAERIAIADVPAAIKRKAGCNCRRLFYFLTFNLQADGMRLFK
ncbi:MAG: hypothetical protein JWN78_674 [Bacteroidota bacterium]|nr:hypothetical protein [Bacteroidota bacterium]